MKPLKVDVCVCYIMRYFLYASLSIRNCEMFGLVHSQYDNMVLALIYRMVEVRWVSNM